MSNETIMLAKTYKKESDLVFPVYMTEKLDGVPGNFSYDPETDRVGCVSRQGHAILSVDHILEELGVLLPKGAHLIGELYIPGMPFKDIGGLVRKQETNSDTRQLKLYIHDYYEEGKEATEYIHRLAACIKLLHIQIMDPSNKIDIIMGKRAEDFEEFCTLRNDFRTQQPQAEGMVFRNCFGKTSIYKTGWRSPGILKDKTVLDIDLPIAGFEEAISKDGEPLGMVGRINAYYASGVTSDEVNDYVDYEVIGVGPGKMSHALRKEVWENQEKYLKKFMEVRYMPDPSYNALREPRFYRFRPDRD